MKYLLLIIPILFLSLQAHTQIRRCGTDTYMAWWLENKVSPKVKTQWQMDRAKAMNLKGHPHSRQPTKHQMLMNESDFLPD